VGVPDQHDAHANLAEEPPTQLVLAARTVRFVECNDGLGIVERLLSFREWYAVFRKVGDLLPRIPSKLHWRILVEVA
jgi:hypothetical protein